MLNSPPPRHLSFVFNESNCSLSDFAGSWCHCRHFIQRHFISFHFMLLLSIGFCFYSCATVFSVVVADGRLLLCHLSTVYMSAMWAIAATCKPKKRQFSFIFISALIVNIISEAIAWPISEMKAVNVGNWPHLVVGFIFNCCRCLTFDKGRRFICCYCRLNGEWNQFPETVNEINLNRSLETNKYTSHSDE